MIITARELRKGDKLMNNGTFFEITAEPYVHLDYVVIKGKGFEANMKPSFRLIRRRPGIYSAMRFNYRYAVSHRDGHTEYFITRQSAERYAAEFGLEVIDLMVSK